MLKTCKYCNISNPDGAHYCAKCGNPLETRKVLSYSLEVKYIVVEESEYNSLVNQRTSLYRENQELKEQINSSLMSRLRKYWNSIKTDVYIWVIVYGSMAIIFFLSMWVFKDCSNT